MRMNRLVMSAAALALSVPCLAGAAIVTPTSPSNTNGSDVFLVVTNQTTYASEVIDLGISAQSLLSASTFENPAGYTTQWTLDPNLFTNLGAGTLTFQLYAGQANSGFSGNYLFSTSDAGNSLALLTQAGNISTANNSAGTYLSNYSGNFSSTSSYLTYFTSSATNSWVTNANATTAPGITLGLAGVNASGTPGSSALVMYEVTSNGTRSSSTTTQTAIGNGTNAGTWSLSANTLTYTLAAVPLPASAWLLISGLLGLGFVSRRRVTSNRLA